MGIRVMIADDSLLAREGVNGVLIGLGHAVVAVATRAEQVVGQVTRHRPELVVMDIRMPPTFTDEGIRLCLTLRERHPRLGLLVLSQYAEPAHAMTLLGHDPRHLGYMIKDRLLDAGMLDDAISRICAGETVIDPTLVADLVTQPRSGNPLDVLTGRERDTLALMAEGLTDRGIAEQLGVSVTTVGTHVQSLFRKLNLPGTATDNRRVRAVLAYLDAS